MIQSSKLGWVAIKLLVSFAVISLIYKQLDSESLRETLTGIKLNQELLLTCGLLMFSQLIIQMFRWKIALKSRQIHFQCAELFKYLWIGLAVNQALPSTVGGDVGRIAMTKRPNNSLLDLTYTVLNERIGGLLTSIIATLWIATLDTTTSASVAKILGRVNDETVTLASALMLGVIATILFIVFRLSPTRVVQTQDGKPKLFSIHHLRSFVFAPKYNLIIYTLTFLSILSYAAMMVLVILSLTGVSMTMYVWFSVFGALIAMAVPISFAGWGVREGFLVIALGQIGIPAESALVVGLMIGVFTLVFALPGLGFIFNQSNSKNTKSRV